MKKIFFITIFFTYSFFSYADSGHQNQIDKLFDQLKNTTSYQESKEIESKIWELWTTHPSENSLTALLADGSFYMSQNNLKTAYETFTKTIEMDSDWAEAWNKRATVLYLMDQYQSSLDDIKITLALEPRHFGALSGQALNYIELNEYEKAIESYKTVQKIYPTMDGAKKMIPQLEELIKDQAV